MSKIVKAVRGRRKRNGENWRDSLRRRSLMLITPRQLANKRVYTDEGIEQATDQLAKSEGGKNIRRMARGSG